jgi:hypothetical protein
MNCVEINSIGNYLFLFMIKIYLLVLICLASSLSSYAQDKQGKSVFDYAAQDKKLIIGKWISKDNVICVFTKDSSYVLVGKDTVLIGTYSIADSCSNKYKGCEISEIFESYELFHDYGYPYHPGDKGEYDCTPFTNLNDSVFYYMALDGSIGEFHHIK